MNNGFYEMKRLLLLAPVLLLMAACGRSEYSTNQVNVVGQEISYSTDEITMNGYISQDENNFDPRPGVLVVHEWWGHDEHARQAADELAKLGYVALAVDMYGNGKQAAHPEDAMKFSNNVMSNFDNAKSRFNAALETLKNRGNVDSTKIGAIGYCFGGSVILAMANSGSNLDGVAAFHAGLQLPVMPQEDLTSRILILNGAEDPLVSDEHVSNLTNSYDEVNADYEYISYDGATHAYTNPIADSLGKKFDLPLAYNAKADSLSWERAKEFLNETFDSGE